MTSSQDETTYDSITTSDGIWHGVLWRMAKMALHRRRQSKIPMEKAKRVEKARTIGEAGMRHGHVVELVEKSGTTPRTRILFGAYFLFAVASWAGGYQTTFCVTTGSRQGR
jgi:hypothetical protein